ncbi:hypothetical protein PR202_ga12768 [Eleusine coracana subsp. coracana]|uniref:Uncharacterized protein n=1 Tax=Eleusine coracana subsp. coracana TaxID=191504 RepID=A0AAV5CCI0_ELECO|nr:hypothetical protein PR202_ga12768 [Eleusine coracana subsp. coracana]
MVNPAGHLADHSRCRRCSEQNAISPNHFPDQLAAPDPYPSVPISVFTRHSPSPSLCVSVCWNPVQFSQPAMLLLYSCLKATAGAQALPIASSSSPCFFFFEGAVALDTERDTVEAEKLRETRRSTKS